MTTRFFHLSNRKVGAGKSCVSVTWSLGTTTHAKLLGLEKHRIFTSHFLASSVEKCVAFHLFIQPFLSTNYRNAKTASEWQKLYVYVLAAGKLSLWKFRFLAERAIFEEHNLFACVYTLSVSMGASTYRQGSLHRYTNQLNFIS